MGGSGGGYFSGSWGPEELAQRVRQAEVGSRTQAFETSVAKHLGSLLAEYNGRDVDAINRIFEQVEADLEDRIEGVVTMLFGGSVSRHTYVNGISDVDALVLFDRADFFSASPRALKKLLAECLSERYGTDAVKVGTLAVTVELGDKTIQLLPARRTKEGFRIASADGTGWSRIAPRRFANALTRHNQRLGGKLVPCIKLIKAMMAGLPDSRQLTGYHTEALAISVFRGYSGPNTTKAMLKFFFDRAGDEVSKPIRDTSGQSVHVDEYLGPPRSTRRRIVGDTLDRIGRRIRNADGAGSLRRWEELFE